MGGTCPKCGADWEWFLRGRVARFNDLAGVFPRWLRRLLQIDQTAIICRSCQEIVGWEVAPRLDHVPDHGHDQGG